MNPSVKAIKEFVIAAHSNLEKVRVMLEAEPDLLTAVYDWGAGGLEDGIGAAAHVGSREIAEFFLEKGAPSNICVAAMLGRVEEVRAYLAEDPALAGARGAHGIPVLFHAAMSGSTEIASMLVAHGGGEGITHALHGAVSFGHEAMTAWILEHGVTDVNSRNFQEKTPLTVALENGHSGIVALLRQHGATE